MPLPEGYIPREGDEVLIRVIVRSNYRDDGDGLVPVAVVGAEHRTLFADIGKIHSLYCRKWNEGDLVKSEEFNGEGVVMATSDEWVWI